MPESRPKTATHYDLLGVKPTASPQQIRRAFRDRSKLYHPDTTELPPAEATERFQQLNEAYAILSSPDRRWTYDKQVGYSRISVMQPLESLAKPPSSPRRQESANLYLDPTDRPLSAGEIFALFILGITFVACLVLVITVGLTRGDYALNANAIPTATAAELASPSAAAKGDTPQETPPLTEAASPPARPKPSQRSSQVPTPQSPTWL